MITSYHPVVWSALDDTSSKLGLHRLYYYSRDTLCCCMVTIVYRMQQMQDAKYRVGSP